MRKLVVWSSVVVLLFASANVFAAAPKKAKRMKMGKKSVWVKDVSKLRVLNKNQRGARLEMGQGTHTAVNYTFKGKGGAGALKGTQVLQQQVERSVAAFERSHPNPVTITKDFSTRALRKAWLDTGGKMLYTDQIKLVRDVVDFYEKQGQAGERVVGPNELELVRYDLPAEKMVIYRAGYDNIEVLNADQYCIIYDPVDNYGQIISVGALEMFAPTK